MATWKRLFAVAVALLLIGSVSGAGVVAAQTSDGSLAVTTAPATDVSTESATLNGELTDVGDAENATVYFEYWQEGDRANSSTTTAITLEEPGSFSAAVDGLENNTTYVYVARAQTENETAVGQERSFTTAATEAVEVETADATAVTNASATLNGELTTLEGAVNATVYFEYWQEGDRANSSTTATLTLEEPGSFSATVDGLESNTTYVYVARAQTENASDVGGQVNFTTNVTADLGVTTEDATNVTEESATLNGVLTGLGDAENATVYFEYWQEGDRANSSTTTTLTLEETGSFSATVDDLESNTTYVYVAKATANGTTVTGEEVTFTTDEEERPTEPFGQRVSAFVHQLLEDRDGVRGIGPDVAEFVLGNNPAADKIPDHAGPPDEGERGPPDQAGPSDEDDEDEEDDEDDEEQGPPDDAGPP